MNGDGKSASYNAIYSDRFGTEHIAKKFKNLWRTKKMITNIYRIQAHDTIMCEYFYIGFIDFMSKDKSLLDCTKLFSPNGYEKNDKIILKYFQ